MLFNFILYGFQMILEQAWCVTIIWFNIYLFYRVCDYTDVGDIVKEKNMSSIYTNCTLIFQHQNRKNIKRKSILCRYPVHLVKDRNLMWQLPPDWKNFKFDLKFSRNCRARFGQISLFGISEKTIIVVLLYLSERRPSRQ